MTSAAAAPALAPAVAHDARFELVPLDRITESPTNHRRRSWGDMEGLTASVREKGVVEPILVRPMKGIGSNLFEIVFGARRFRASKAAGRAEIPALIRELSDLEVVELQVIENLQRADVHPLEEAEGYEQLLQSTERQYSVDEIAAKVGKSKAYVYGRMKLLALCKEAREAFYDGALTPSVALLVARIPGEDLQKKALKRLDPRGDCGGDVGDPIPFREAARVVHQEFMLKLDDAPFSATDAELLPGAGACSACPKRSGSQPELFADVASADVCSDPTCYREKVNAAWARRSAAAKAEGRTVLAAKDAKEAFSDYGWGKPEVSYRADYVDADKECVDDPKNRTYRKLLGKRIEEAVVLARDPKGNVRELLPKAGLARLLKEAGHDFKKRASSASSSSTPRRATKTEIAKAKEDGAIRQAVDRRKAELLIEACRRAGKDVEIWRLAVAELAMMDDSDLLARRFPGPEKEEYRAKEKRLAGEIAKIDLGELHALALALVLGVHLDYGQHKAKVLKWAGIDQKKVEAEVKAQRAAAAPPAETAPAKEGHGGGARERWTAVSGAKVPNWVKAVAGDMTAARRGPGGRDPREHRRRRAHEEGAEGPRRRAEEGRAPWVERRLAPPPRRA
jgi:ParB/RepB/Spo0J family partition protein